MAIARSFQPYRTDQTRFDNKIIEISGNPISGGGYVTTYTDVTERKRAEGVLQQSEKRFRDFAESAADLFWEMDEDLRFTYCSPNAERVVGAPAEWYYGKTREELLGAGRDRKIWAAHLEDLAARRPFRDFTYHPVGKGIEPMWLRTSGVPVFDADGAFKGYRGTARDVTDTVETQQAVARSRDELRLLADSLPTGVAVIDRDRRYLFINKKLEAWFRRPASEVIGRKVQEILGAEFAERTPATAERGLAGHSATIRDKISYPDGQERDVEISYVPQRDKDGTVIKCIIVSHDMTAYVHATEEVRRSEQRFARYADASADWFWEMDETLRFTYLSPSIERLHDMKVESLLGKTREEAMDLGNDREALDAHVALLDRREPFRDFVFFRESRTGEPAWVSISGVPMISEDGRFTGYCGTGRDVTDVYNIQRAIQRGRDQLRLIADNLPARVFMLDSERRFAFVNKALAQVYGRPMQEIVGKTFLEIVGKDRDDAVKAYQVRALAGETFVRTDRTVDADGTEHDFQITYVPQRDATGQVTQFLVLAVDVSEHLRTANELYQRH